MSTKKIASIRVVKPGSNPDIDSDFHTQHREEALQYVTELYGKDNVANIVTFNSLAAKSAFKSLCTIYQIPFKEANQLARLIPDPQDGKDIKFGDMFDENSERYGDAEEFRNAISEPKWKKIIDGAVSIEGKNKSTGVHACGIIISSKPLSDTIPLQVRKEDNRVITQWVYQDCESIGLIKMDFLGLDTVDLIQSTVENIIRAGKTPPNLPEIIHGDMDDEKVFKMFQEGNSVGVFQFGSEMVRELLVRMKPTGFNDLVACTAVARPGPMGMKSHERYADRKNGREKLDFIHKDFDNSPMTEILKQTYGLVLYQEQVTQIANQISGMTLQEGDDLRKAMGKKKHAVMMKMKPKFISGGISNGYSEEAMNLLWDTLEPFSQYAFNKSHSVAYAINAYQAAYLKTHYPVEFMSALIQQNIDNRDKTLAFLREARRLGITVNAPDVNRSGVKIEPDLGDEAGTTISFGLSAVKDVGGVDAQALIEEREKNGKFSSAKDLAKRCQAVGVGKKVVVALSRSGACDAFHPNRKAVCDYMLREVAQAKKNKGAGENLFELLGIEDESVTIDENIEETFAERVVAEANLLGFYLSAHPLDNIPRLKGHSFEAAESRRGNGGTSVFASCYNIVTKRGRGRTSHKLYIEDGRSDISVYAPRNVVARWDKFSAQNQVIRAAESEGKSVKDEVLRTAFAPEVIAAPALETHQIAQYIISSGWSGARAVDITPVWQSQDGSLASTAVINVPMNEEKREKYIEFLKTKFEILNKEVPGEKTLFVSFVPDMRRRAKWPEVVNTPAQTFDENALRKAMKAGYIERSFVSDYMKSLYTDRELLSYNDNKQSMIEFENLHKMYKYTDVGLRIDPLNEKTPKLMDKIFGNGNYYLRK